MRIVVDASVALKWFLRSPDEESDGAAALDVLRAIHEDRLAMVQPPHFIAEVSAVLAREGARFADEALRDLLEIEQETVADQGVYRRAMVLSRRLNHHLFDTLYHAVALETPHALSSPPMSAITGLRSAKDALPCSETSSRTAAPLRGSALPFRPRSASRLWRHNRHNDAHSAASSGISAPGTRNRTSMNAMASRLRPGKELVVDVESGLHGSLMAVRICEYRFLYDFLPLKSASEEPIRSPGNPSPVWAPHTGTAARHRARAAHRTRRRTRPRCRCGTRAAAPR